ncbi:MAG: S-methyl-5'-thioinosine phosphorylase, partial [Pseudomonadota bacterium]
MALALIGGTGLDNLQGLVLKDTHVLDTHYGSISVPVQEGDYHGQQVMFLARHGHEHSVPPHQINYRANIWALHELGVHNVIASAAVGAINSLMKPADVVIANQIVDYTWGREHTFFEYGHGPLQRVHHIDFTEPYSENLRHSLIHAAEIAKIPFHDRGVCGVTQGPRLETASEINRMERDGCDIVGMTTMPEASLARELNMKYATCAFVINPAAGRGNNISEEIETYLERGANNMRTLI